MVISPVCIVFSQYNTFQSPAGEGEYQKCPPLALWANIAETSFDIERLSRKGAVTENGSCHCWFPTETFAWHGTSSPSPSRLTPCHLSQSERPWHSGEVTGQTAKVYGFASGSPFGGAGALAPERARTLPRSAALSQKAALQMLFSSTTPPVKKGFRNARRRF